MYGEEKRAAEKAHINPTMAMGTAPKTAPVLPRLEVVEGRLKELEQVIGDLQVRLSRIVATLGLE